MDTLSRVLNTLELDSSFYFSVSFRGNWSVTIPSYKRVARFHICCRGKSLFKIEGVDKPVLVDQGEIIIIPHGSVHTLMSEEGVATQVLDQAFVNANYDGSYFFEYGDGIGPRYNDLLCGHFEFQHVLPHPFIDQLPVYILLKKNNAERFDKLEWLTEALLRYTREDRLEAAGNRLIIKHLSEITFTFAIQYWQRSQDKPNGFIAAIADPHLSKVLDSFHQDPAQRWQIEDLADVAGMSRTSFIDYFTNTVKMTPKQYVTLWRMISAQKMLRTTLNSVQQIANFCGYESAASFSKAFKRFTGESPGEFRKIYTDVEPNFELSP